MPIGGLRTLQERPDMDNQENTGNIAVIRIRGEIGVSHDVEDALKSLNLSHKNYCVVQKSSPTLLGVLHKIKDRVTYGEIEDETYDLLCKKRGEPYQGRIKDAREKISYARKWMEIDGKKLKPVFRLNNPKGGFERKGIKTGYGAGGVLGYRGRAINELIVRMIH